MGYISTVNMTDEQWLEERKKGIGGSDVTTILGLNPYKTQHRLWLEKTNREPAEIIKNDATDMGTMLEPIVAQRYSELSGNAVRMDNKIRFRDDKPFLRGNIDRMIVGKNAGLECKTTTKFALEKYAEDPVPLPYFLQSCHYLIVSGFDFWDIATLIDGRTLSQFHVERNEEFLSTLEADITQWWDTHIVGDKEPTKEVSDFKSMKKIAPITVEASDDIYQAYIAQQSLASKIKELEGELELAEDIIKKAIGDNEAIEYHGIPLATWKSQTQKRFDSKRFESEQPEVYKKFINEISFRVFRAKKLK